MFSRSTTFRTARWLGCGAGLLACAMATSTNAHDQIPGAPQSQPIIITGGTIHPVDGPSIENGSVLFESGKITAVGKEVSPPANVVEIDATGKHVYPGLIEPMSDIGLVEVRSVRATDDRIEFGQLNPNARSWVAVNPDSELIPVARANGVLTVLSAPAGFWIRGQSAVLNLDGWTAKEMAILAPAGLHVQWSAVSVRRSDGDRLRKQREERLVELDALLDEARRYGELRATQPEETPTNVRLESLLPVISAERPLVVQANRQSEIESAIAYAQTQGLRLIIHGGYDAEKCAELLKQYDIPVIISATYRLPQRRDDAYDAPFTLPERLRQAGVRFAISGAGAGSGGGSANARNLPYHAAVAVAYGLPYGDGLRSITLSAAEILGVGDQVGSLSVGKDATLFIADGDILETKTLVSDAFIQGRAVDLGSRHKMLYEKYQKKYEVGADR